MRGNLGAAAWRLAAFIAVCLLGMFALFAVFAELRFEKSSDYRAHFANVSGLEDDDFVRIAGVEVGKVKKINVNDDGTVMVDFAADQSVVLTEGSRAVIRYDDLIGGRYLSLVEGAGVTERLNSGGHHPAGPHPARSGSGCVDRRLPSAVPCAGARTDQRAVGSADQRAAGAGRDHRLVPVADGVVDQHTGRPRSADRRGDRQPQHGVGFAGGQSEQFDKGVVAISELVETLGERKQDIANGIAYTSEAAAPSRICCPPRARRCRR